MMARTLISGLLLAVLLLRPDGAAAQTAAPPQDQDANTGNDLFRPPANLFQMMYDYKTAPGSGSAPGSTRDVTTETLNLRMDHSLDLAPLWILALRADLPLLAKNPISSSNPEGNYFGGVGDADVQAIIIHNLNQRWTIGFGGRLITPTGGDTFGSGKWQIMPAAGFRYALWEISSSSYFEPVVRYDVSFAGDPTRRNISILQFGPTFNLGLPDRWFLTFYPSPDIRINYGDPITGHGGFVLAASVTSGWVERDIMRNPTSACCLTTSYSAGVSRPGLSRMPSGTLILPTSCIALASRMSSQRASGIPVRRASSAV